MLWVRCVCVRERVRAHLFAEVMFVPRGSAPPELDGRGAQQVLDAAPDGSGSVRGHSSVSRVCRRLQLSPRRREDPTIHHKSPPLALSCCSPSRAEPGRSASLDLVPHGLTQFPAAPHISLFLRRSRNQSEAAESS